MKKLLLIFVFATFIIGTIYSQKIKIPTIGSKAPSFTANSTNGEITFPGQFGDSWKILFSHPQDFTPVCSSELLELAFMQSEFKSRGIMVAVISTDDLNQHNNWKMHLEALNYKDRGTQKIRFPLFEDQNHAISKKYGMLHGSESSTKDIRGVFIIDSKNIIRSINFYPMQVGRNMHEILRIVDALQTADAEQVVTPANWNKGEDVMVPHRPFTKQQLAANPGLIDKYYTIDDMMWFKKIAEK